jgi:hypothetical protein
MIIVLRVLAFINKHYKALYLIYQGLELLVNFLKKETTMGLWSKNAEKGFSQFIDDKLKLPLWAEPFDGMLVNYTMGYIDGKYSDKIPEILKPVYIRVGGVFEQYEKDKTLDIAELISAEDISTIITNLIDIPMLTEDEETILMTAIVQGLFAVIKNYIEKKKKEKSQL